MRPAILARRTGCDRRASVLNLCCVVPCRLLYRTRGLAGLLRFNFLTMASVRMQSLSSSSTGVPVSVIPVAIPTSTVAAPSAVSVHHDVARRAYVTSPAHFQYWIWSVMVVSVVVIVFTMVSGFGDDSKERRGGEGEGDRERRGFYRYGCIGE